MNKLAQRTGSAGDYRVATTALIAGLAMGSGAAWAQGPLADPFPPIFEIGALLPSQGGDGSLGFVVGGPGVFVGSGGQFGDPVAAAGDVNGDGYDDLIVGNPGGEFGPCCDAGVAYVIFGTPAGFPALLDASQLDGSNGFVLAGTAPTNNTGAAVAGGVDINGDGFDDVIVSAPYADVPGRVDAGVVYVVFGSDAGFPAVLPLADLDGQNGFRIDGEAGNDLGGLNLAGVKDMNGDGLDEIAIGSPLKPVGAYYSGTVFVVFGRRGPSPFGPSFDIRDVNGTNGFRFRPSRENDGVIGFDVSDVGDVNGDGLADLGVGAVGGGEGFDSIGAAYVIFGRPTAAGGFPPSLRPVQLDGTRGITMRGPDFFSGALDFGVQIGAAGDINGDGIADLAVSGTLAAPSGRDNAGVVAIVFGRTGLSSDIRTGQLDGTTGFWADGGQAGDYAGSSIDSPGDINGDGVDDLAIGAVGASPPGRRFAGKTFVVYGTRAPFAARVDLGALDGSNGFAAFGSDGQELFGEHVAAAGDVNADGRPDLAVTRSVEEGPYVIFGRGDGEPPVCTPDLDGDGELTIFDFLAFQNLFDAMDPIADFDGDGSFTIFDFLAFQNAFDAGCR